MLSKISQSTNLTSVRILKSIKGISKKRRGDHPSRGACYRKGKRQNTANYHSQPWSTIMRHKINLFSYEKCRLTKFLPPSILNIGIQLSQIQLSIRSLRPKDYICLLKKYNKWDCPFFLFPSY